MNNLYYICDDMDNVLFSCKDFIECYDFSGIGYTYLFVLTGISTQDVDFLPNGQLVTLKSSSFDGRLNVSFSVRKLIKSDDTLYLYIEDLRPDMYELGAISLLKARKYDDQRIWLDMKGDKKRIYISASYLISGERISIEKDTVVIEGKYIQDYYSFYCELGYSFFGNFGYIGNSIYSLDDYLAKLEKVNIIWEDSEISLKAIDNTMPEGYNGISSYDLVSTLEEYCNLVLN
ncbi:hypothetical protein [Xenorhabdus sp. KK7.4]|uniref:hypothetical protein n=1 Tax=Xenorhabdus sp. KK7.4 TaxID=1851572 RepID=UPI000C03DB40|nr:hypothetical protein [Xenorhabdus sp. KK7.4]PHM53888.1 hypothetical protein Xekk_02800 [Xenorhabdus sp. KK7.4]